MVTFFLVMRWWLILSLLSIAGLGAIVAWGWLTTRRLPFARWKVTISQSPSRRITLIREIVRIRRIRV